MKILVVGLGSMGKRRIRNLRQIGVEGIAGFDPRQDRRDEAQGKYHVHVFSDFAAGMAWGPGAVVISTPPDLHMTYAKAAADAGMHFFTEAGVSTAGVAEAVAAAQAAGVVAAPSCTMRFHPSVKRIKSLLAESAIGRLLTFTHHCGQYLPDWHPWEDYRDFYVSKRETGACREIAPFELLWLTWLVGEVELVTGLRGKLSDLDADIDDVYHLLVRCRSGITGHVLVDVVARSALRSLRLLGTDGTIEWSLGEKAVRVYDARSKEWATHEEPPAIIEPGYGAFSIEGMYVDEMTAFLDACDGRAPYPYTYGEDARILAILSAAEKSSDEGVHVKVRDGV